MSEVYCSLCGECCQWTQAPFYESHSWELETRHYRNYREIRLPRKYHLVNLYEIVICQSCEHGDWHKKVMAKINSTALQNLKDQLKCAQSNLKDAQAEVTKRENMLKELQDLKF